MIATCRYCGTPFGPGTRLSEYLRCPAVPHGVHHWIPASSPEPARDGRQAK